jgi:catechol 2,3-dioxygenase-like lactoylglutathione lyase family enzyme
MKFGPPIPILRSFDAAKAREFYVDFLGFRLDWEHQFEPNTPGYIQVSLGDCVLHLSEHFGDSCPGSGMRVRVDDIDAYQQGLLAKQYRHSRPGCAEKMPWGTRELTIADPFGNRITFYQDADPASVS